MCVCGGGLFFISPVTGLGRTAVVHTHWCKRCLVPVGLQTEVWGGCWFDCHGVTTGPLLRSHLRPAVPQTNRKRSELWWHLLQQLQPFISLKFKRNGLIHNKTRPLIHFKSFLFEPIKMFLGSFCMALSENSITSGTTGCDI